MARVRDHAAEYAAIKARAQAAGLSTRAYRRARKENPLRYGAPRTQKSIRAKLFKLEPIETANITPQHKAGIEAKLANALRRRGAPPTDIAGTIRRRIQHSTPDQLQRFEKIYDDIGDGAFWLEPEDYDDIGHLFWYRDS